MATYKFLEYTDAVGAALHRAKNLPPQKTNTDIYPHSPKQQLLPGYRPSGEATASAEYNGYFTLKDVSTRDEQGNITAVRIAVCDGETWDAEHETSGDSYLRVNYDQYNVLCEVLTGVERYIYIECDASTSPPLISIISSATTKSDDVGNSLYYYLLGEWYNNQIIQRHNNGIGNGIAQVWPVTVNCGIDE